MIETDAEKWFIVAQSPKEDWDSLKIGFQTIFDSISIESATTKENQKMISPTPAGKKK